MIGNNGSFGFDMGALLGNLVGNQNNGFGNDGGIWAIILIIALCGGFRNGGGLFSGGNGGGGEASLDAALQRGFDNQSVINKLNALENGLCSVGYDQLNQINGVNNTVRQTGSDIQGSLQNLLIALMQQGFNQSSQTKDCCCTIENLLQAANYNRQADTCAITNAINQAAQSIMQNDNCNYRSLYDQQVQLQMQQKDETIAQLRSALDRCDSRSDNAAQTAQIVSQVIGALKDPTPVPAYVVQNPNGCGCNNNSWANWFPWFNNLFCGSNFQGFAS